ncbi:MAG TPA: amino acid adenylation domain-containing protein, partial [Telluria sp.]|nr:amino acid adenylation domain-containing protein [Telluria sp.]
PSAFVTLAEWPLTPNGKLDRKALPAPDMLALAARTYEAPQGEVECAIAAIWQDLLGVAQVGRHDHFFELGGHSLMAIQLVSRMNESLGVVVALRDLFAAPTLSALASVAAQARRAVHSAIARADREGKLPLSWAQQRLWFLDQLDHAAGVAYHMPVGLRLTGQLDKAALQATLDRIIARHENLRTTFIRIDGEPVQRIADHATFSLREHDLSALTGHEQEFAVRHHSIDEAGHPFDMAQGPLIRGQLLRLAEDEHILLVTQHHIISDGWSIGVLVGEVKQLYRAFCLGQPDPLPPLALQYADYAVWQRGWLQGETLDEQVAFWKGHLAGAPALIELPSDFPRPSVQSYAGDTLSLSLPAELSAGLRALGKRHGTTLFMTMLAGWSALLARLSGQDDIVIGTPVANRQRSEVEALIGFFVNTLAIRVRLDQDPSVAQLLAHVKSVTLDAYSHQDLPFEQVVEAVKPPRSMAHSPIFQVMLTMNNTPDNGGLELPGLTLAPVSAPRATTQFDLSLSLAEYGETIEASFEYSIDLYERATIDRLAGHFVTLLGAMVADEQQALSRLPLLSESQTQAIVAGFNQTEADFEQGLGLHELFEAQVQCDGAAIALVFGDERLSYAELNRRANQVAHYLQGCGVKPDDRVALCLERGVELVVALLGVLKAGAAYVPLDSAYPIERLAYMIGDSAPVVLITGQSMAASLAGSAATMLVMDEPAACELLARQVEHDPEWAAGFSHAANMAYVLYTSGSTGLPKGVMVEHRNVVNLVQHHASLCRLTRADRVLQFASFGFDNSIAEVFPALASGARIVLRPADLMVPDQDFAAFVDHHRITMADLPTSFWHQWAGEIAQGRSRPGASLRLVVAGGEKAEVRHLANWFAPGNGVDCRWINTYGPTEATVNATTMSYERGSALPELDIPIGRPVANAQAYILDRHLQPVPVGVAGEIFIGGAGVARGYLNKPELSAERFVANPFSQIPGERMYKTGDLGRWLPDGTIAYLGRNDFQVKLRGFRIELGEIEAQLLACDGVKEALVIAREDNPGDKRLVAYLLAHDGVALDVAALRTTLSVCLAEYMVPSAFVVLDAYPLNPNGKLDRKALPAPDQSAVVAREYEAPQDAIEGALAAVWEELLGLDQVGRHDHFFELGGHSLMVITLIEKLRQRGMKADVKAVFTAPTLAAMAALMRQAGAAEHAVPANPITRDSVAITPQMLPLVDLNQQQIDAVVASVTGGVANIQDIYPLAPLQAGILFHHMLQTTGDTYLQRSLLSFDSRARMEAFIGALETVIARHDILRTAVLWHGLPEPVQVVYRAAELPLHELALDPAGGSPMEQLQARTNPRHTRLDVQRAPMLAATYAVDADSGEYHLALLDHHLVCDHVSLDFIIGEIGLLLAGRGEALPSTLPYRNFIAQIRAVSDAEHETYFRQQLGDIAEPTAPFGLLDVQGSGAGVVEAREELDAELAQEIRSVARRHGVTPAVLFHAALGQVFAQVCGREDVVFGTVLSGRLQGSEGADTVLGMFINTLPVRISLGERSVREVVAESYQRLTELLVHEQASLALAQRCSGVEASAPLFTALLNYRHSHRKSASAEAAYDQAWQGIRIAQNEERTNYPITTYVDDLGDGFCLSARCHGVDPQRLVGMFATAIAALVAALENAPGSTMAAIDILPQGEREQLLEQFNATSQNFPEGRTMHQMFEAQVRANPAAPAVSYEGHTLSYEELNTRANLVAMELRELGVHADDMVALCVERSVEMMVGLLGILKSGAAYVPMDPAYPAERLAYMLKDCAPRALLTQPSLARLLPALSLPVIALDAGVALAGPVRNPEQLGPGRRDADLAYVIYTSGSTGSAKGVMVEHRSAVNFWEVLKSSTHLHCGPQSRVALNASFAFDMSLKGILQLLSGHCLHIVPQLIRADGAAMLDWLERHRIDAFDVTPSQLEVLVGAGLLDHPRYRPT